MIDNSRAIQVEMIYFVWKISGNSGGLKLKIERDPVIVDWHNIYFFLVPF